MLDMAADEDDEEEHDYRGNIADTRYDNNFLKRRNKDVKDVVGSMQERFEEQERRRVEREKRR
jgi:hypothetical protein